MIPVVVGLRLGEKGALFAAVDDGSATECRQQVTGSKSYRSLLQPSGGWHGAFLAADWVA